MSATVASFALCPTRPIGTIPCMTFLAPPRLVGLALLAVPATAAAPPPSSTGAPPLAVEPMQAGPFEPTWESLAHYQCRTGFATRSSASGRTGARSASPSRATGTRANVRGGQRGLQRSRRALRPSVERRFQGRDPRVEGGELGSGEAAGALQEAGAKYFMALANHHDNFDIWDSSISRGTPSARAEERSDRRLGEGGAKERTALRR